jgi:translation initiation factor 3 subunit C
MSSSSGTSSSSESEDEKPKTATTATTGAATAGKKKKVTTTTKKSSSSSSSSSESSDSEQAKKQTTAATKQKNKYVHSESESDDEDANRTRTVKTAKEKALDQIARSSRDLRMSLSSDDWPKTKELFEGLNKLLTKHQRALEGSPTPEPYLEAMVALEAEVKELAEDKESAKKLSQLRYKAWSAIQSKLAKHLQPFRAEMEALPEKKPEEEAEVEKEDDGEASSTESEASSSSSGESSSGESSSSGSDDDSEDESGSESSSDFESDSESSSSSSSDEEVGKLTGRDKWVKRSNLLKTERPQDKSTPSTIAAAEVKRLQKLRMAQARREGKIQEEKERKAREAAVVLTGRDVERLIMATASKLWKRDANRRELSEALRGHVARAVPFGPRTVLPALMHLVSSQFDSKNIDDCMSIERWRNAVSDLHFILRILAKNPELRLAPMAADETLDASGGLAGSTETVEQILSEAARASQGDTQAIQAREKAKANPTEAESQRREDNPNVVYVVGDISAFASRLATELNKALRNTPPHTAEFLERLQDESALLELAETVQEFLERVGDYYGASKQALLRVELMYYKHDSIAIPSHAAHVRQKTLGHVWHPAAFSVSYAGENAFINNDPASCSPVARPINVEISELDVAQTIDQLCTFIYKEGDDVSKNRAMLCQIYHHALHDRFHKARDLLLMSHLQDNIQNTDAEMQILFNRVIVQLGLCGFRCGNMQDAHSCLQEICGQGRTKELLAQGVGWRKQHERDVERENLERRRLVPYHMHIDLELVECCHLTSAMLLEISNLATAEHKASGGHYDDRHHSQDDVISRAFRKYLDTYERAVFTGPPENIRDHIMASAVALREGDWKTSADHVLNLPVWENVPTAATVKQMLESKIKGEALRVYLLTFAAYYESMRLDALCELYALDRASVRIVLAKLILSKTLHASWDEEVVRLHKIVPTNLQALALQFSDKTRDLVDNNERMFDRLTGGGEQKREHRGEHRGEDGEKRHWKRDRQGGGGGGGGGGRDGRDGGRDRRGRGGGGGGGPSHLVQRGYRSDRSRSGAAGGNTQSNW